MRQSGSNSEREAEKQREGEARVKRVKEREQQNNKTGSLGLHRSGGPQGPGLVGGPDVGKSR